MWFVLENDKDLMHTLLSKVKVICPQSNLLKKNNNSYLASLTSKSTKMEAGSRFAADPAELIHLKKTIKLTS